MVVVVVVAAAAAVVVVAVVITAADSRGVLRGRRLNGSHSGSGMVLLSKLFRCFIRFWFLKRPASQASLMRGGLKR